jgi:hypothetical protein
VQSAPEAKDDAILIGGAEDFLRFWSERSHALAAAQAGADQHEAPDDIGGLKCDFLRDKAADENPSTSTFVSPSALMNATALATIFSNVVGTSPKELDTPALFEQWRPKRVRIESGHIIRRSNNKDDGHA